ncbi:MAG: ATP synthase F1 subunit delta [Salinivirgaceae bacterium]|nr:ATP synthase F1 subunit delta [Salinivirgaceae bacterium]
MNQSKISVRYAKALFELAQDKNSLSAIKQDMQWVEEVCQQPDFNLLLESPVIKASQKTALMQKFFQGKVNEWTLKFLIMVVENRREQYLQNIARDFIQNYRDFTGIKAAKVTTAAPIDGQTKKLIDQLVKRIFNAQVELVSEENPKLKGGFILRVGDQQIDASINTKLKKIKRKFIDTTI